MNQVSYKELEEKYTKLFEEYRMLNSVLKRVDYLFKVLEHSDKFGSDFVISCAEEIQKLLTIENK